MWCTSITSSWLTRDNSLLHKSLNDVFQLFPVSTVLSRRSFFVSIQTRISVGTLFFRSLDHWTCSEPDCAAVWTRGEYSADCSLNCRRRICSLVVWSFVRSRQYTHSFDVHALPCQHILLFLKQLHHLLRKSIMCCTDLRNVLICIGYLIESRSLALLLASFHDGKLRSWSFHTSASVGVHWQTSFWDITICSDRALCEFIVYVLDWMSVHDCCLVDDQTVAMFGNITASLEHSLLITICTRTFATMNLHPSCDTRYYNACASSSKSSTMSSPSTTSDHLCVIPKLELESATPRARIICSSFRCHSWQSVIKLFNNKPLGTIISRLDCSNLGQHQTNASERQLKWTAPRNSTCHFFFFFKRTWRKSASGGVSKKGRLHLVTVVPDHLSWGTRHTVKTRSAASLQKGQRKRSCCCARQQCRPPSHPRALDRLPEVLWLIPHLCVSQQMERNEGLPRPPAAHWEDVIDSILFFQASLDFRRHNFESEKKVDFCALNILSTPIYDR